MYSMECGIIAYIDVKRIKKSKWNEISLILASRYNMYK